MPIVCKPKESLYKLKQDPKAWIQKLSNCFLNIGFVNSKLDASLFYTSQGDAITMILVYMDDIIIIGNNERFIQEVLSSLNT